MLNLAKFCYIYFYFMNSRVVVLFGMGIPFSFEDLGWMFLGIRKPCWMLLDSRLQYLPNMYENLDFLKHQMKKIELNMHIHQHITPPPPPVHLHAVTHLLQTDDIWRKVIGGSWAVVQSGIISGPYYHLAT